MVGFGLGIKITHKLLTFHSVQKTRKLFQNMLMTGSKKPPKRILKNAYVNPQLRGRFVEEFDTLSNTVNNVRTSLARAK